MGGAVDPVAQSLAALDDGLTEAFGDAVELRHQRLAALRHGVGETRVGMVDAVDERLRALAEIARHRRARPGEPLGGRIALHGSLRPSPRRWRACGRPSRRSGR